MSWNNGLERKKFESRMTKQAKEYRKAGMTEEQIKAMYEFDLEQFNCDRKYYRYTQPLEEHEFEEDGEESDNSLLKQFIDVLSTTVEDDYETYTRYGWIETIDNPKLAELLHEMSELDIEILTMTVFEGYKLIELEEVLSVPYITLKRHYGTIKKKISSFFE